MKNVVRIAGMCLLGALLALALVPAREAQARTIQLFLDGIPVNGEPAPVIREARRRLRALENREIGTGPQPDLFAALPDDVPVALSHPALTALEEIDPDSLTPRDALERLYLLKRML